MVTDRYKLFYLIMISTLLVELGSSKEPSAEEASNVAEDSGIPEVRALFSPRADYNEWIPVGRGDPLKKDPTYDYSPPTLDRVRYWADTNKEKKEILLLGVTSKRQSHKKDPKFSSVRRSYYAHLPTRLMPPPLQTIPPPKTSSTEGYQNNFQYNVYKPNSNSGWSYNDVRSDESINFAALNRPEESPKRKPLKNIEVNVVNTVQRKPWLHELLQKEATKPIATEIAMEPSKNIYEFHGSTLSSYVPVTFVTTTDIPTPTIFQPTIPPTSMTTDSLFSHYKQPSQPFHGPMYLIIEGHSKVKTYGLKDNETDLILHKPKIVPVPVKKDPVIKHVVSEDDKGKAAEVKHLAKKALSKENLTEQPSAMKSLLSFLDTSLGNFFLNDVEVAKNKTNDQETSTHKTNQEEIRESRQIFDYDQLPESIIKEAKDDVLMTTEPRSSDTTIESAFTSTEPT